MNSRNTLLRDQGASILHCVLQSYAKILRELWKASAQRLSTVHMTQTPGDVREFPYEQTMKTVSCMSNTVQLLQKTYTVQSFAVHFIAARFRKMWGSHCHDGGLTPAINDYVRKQERTPRVLYRVEVCCLQVELNASSRNRQNPNRADLLTCSKCNCCWQQLLARAALAPCSTR